MGVRAAEPDPSIRQELVETLYHVLWELVHVFFDHRGLLEGRDARRMHDTGASSFLYPFLAEREHDLDAVLDDVRRSVSRRRRRSASCARRRWTTTASELLAAAGGLARTSTPAASLALGNGGSATDAMDVVADFHCPPEPAGRRGRPST